MTPTIYEFGLNSRIKHWTKNSASVETLLVEQVFKTYILKIHSHLNSYKMNDR